MKVVVTGIGSICCLGTLETSWQNLISGQSGIRVHQPFPELEARPLALIGNKPAELLRLTRLVVTLALKDANLLPPLSNCGVAIGSSRSQQAVWEKLASISAFPIDGEAGKSLKDWLETLPHMGAIAAARQIATIGPVLAPMAACATGIWSIAQGFELIQTRQCDMVIAGAVEAPITRLTLAGFKQMGALAKTGAYPFDRYREGLVLGEGAAVLVLESLESAKRRGAKIYGQVLGFGLTNDAHYANAPEEGGWNAIAAIKQCLERSNLSPNDIDYIHAHGTATQLNDRNEAQVIRYLFPQNVPISSTKGATGHTLGASGALGTAFCLMGLHHQILPPCIGLKESEFDLNFVRKARPCEIRNVLCLSFGFGGQNAVLALGKI
ncbi:beta-ketoacyl-ACP synthase [Planktothrix sp. FACHB-1355]|uniref:Beta-ketoacyl-ACP synthase n=1 Tax=Aerosakkonema funiforme FACHB-1375 TaxID=2949571 RepID=A0A926VKA7_9CYAN|nr:beta-ketoacyl-ACP synthase [Aerosakkonema funiforme]MBD2185314.1 beta-ketoacyl-ACP synthase [Aerosakkonema funiforme FACHB-1375]MBD3559161.1 beta-ketoacyl-ACP synthase [Planktothrix sp. FACHB-1355]